MSHPTYSLHPSGAAPGAYQKAVAALADEVMAMGEDLRPTIDAYGYFMAETGCEERRSYEEYLLEALMIGVLWRARGHEATVAAGMGNGLVHLLVGERRAGCGRRRDGSNQQDPRQPRQVCAHTRPQPQRRSRFAKTSPPRGL